MHLGATMAIFKIQLTFFVISNLVASVYCDVRHSGGRLPGYVIRTEYGISFNKCMRHCDNTVNCLSVNYFRKTNFCELSSKTIANGINLNVIPGYTYAEKRQSGEVCTNLNCSTGDTCENNICKTTQCSYNLNVNNGIVHGNMFAFGAQRVIECLPNFHLIFGDRITICTDQGKWGNASDIRCEQQCPPPTEIVGGTIVRSNISTTSGRQIFYGNEWTGLDLFIMDSSYVTYQCDSKRRMYGSATITCLSEIWSPYPQCRYTYDQDCAGNHDCSEPGLTCHQGNCQCIILARYSYRDRQCTGICSYGLGSTFQIHTGMQLPSGIFHTYIGFSLSSCKSVCTTRYAHICQGFNHKPSARRCALVGQYSEESEFDYDPDYDFYKRNCV